MTAAVIYPRGFLGFDIGLPVTKAKPVSVQTVVMAYRRNDSASDVMPDPYISNHIVDDLWNKYKQNTAESRSLAFEEKILKAALTAFSTKDFYSWCEIQFKSPYFDDMHRKFLNDTLTFVNTGQRKMNPQSWKSLLRPTRTPLNTKTVFDYKSYFDGTLGAELNESICIPTRDLVSTITHWVSQPDGMSDLLCCLTILFGKLEIHN